MLRKTHHALNEPSTTCPPCKTTNNDCVRFVCCLRFPSEAAEPIERSSVLRNREQKRSKVVESCRQMVEGAGKGKETRRPPSLATGPSLPFHHGASHSLLSLPARARSLQPSRSRLYCCAGEWTALDVRFEILPEKRLGPGRTAGRCV